MDKLVSMSNIATELDDEYLNYLGKCVIDEYHLDRNSRDKWEQRNKDAIKLALQVVEQKTTPWVGASNVKFPLVTIACLQFLARISILTRGRKLVQCDMLGIDPTGKEFQRAKRISAHMSYQLVEEDINWIDDDEKTKFAAAILGSGFKKTYFDPVAGINISEFVPAYSFVVDYYTKNLDGKTRCTHIIPMFSNDIEERVRMGLFLKDDDKVNPQISTDSNVLKEEKDKAQGINEPSNDPDRPYEILEQHRWMDLDGDGFKEPYVVLVRLDTGKVYRVVARYFDEGDVHRKNDKEILFLERDRRDAMIHSFNDVEAQKKRIEEYDLKIKNLREAKDNVIIRIDPINYFTKWVLLPSPDGGFYGLGFGSLLGPVNAAVDTGINQIIDTATLYNRSGGVLGRGVKLKGGNLEMDKWTPVDSTGDDIRKNVMPWPTKEPSAVLFQMLQLLISYGERIAGATDIMSGVSPGQNTPAETSRNTIEQGMKLFSGIYQRMYRSFQEELRKIYKLNSLHMQESAKFLDLSTGEGAIIGRDDYIKGDVIVRPAADASSVSESQLQQKALMVSQRASSTPGYNLYAVEHNLLESFDIQNIEQIYPDPNGPNKIPPPVNPRVQMEQIKQETKKLELQRKEQEFMFEIEVKKFELQQKVEMQQAEIMKMMAEIVKIQAETKGVDTGHQIAMIEAEIGAAKAHRDDLLKTIEIMSKHQLSMKEKEIEQEQGRMANSNGNTQVSGRVDSGEGRNEGNLG